MLFASLAQSGLGRRSGIVILSAVAIIALAFRWAASHATPRNHLVLPSSPFQDPTGYGRAYNNRRNIRNFATKILRALRRICEECQVIRPVSISSPLQYGKREIMSSANKELFQGLREEIAKRGVLVHISMRTPD